MASRIGCRMALKQYLTSILTGILASPGARLVYQIRNSHFWASAFRFGPPFTANLEGKPTFRPRPPFVPTLASTLATTFAPRRFTGTLAAVIFCGCRYFFLHGLFLVNDRHPGRVWAAPCKSPLLASVRLRCSDCGCARLPVKP